MSAPEAKSTDAIGLETENVDGAKSDWCASLTGIPAVLLQRLQSQAKGRDFPAMSAQIMKVYQLTGDENEQLERLTDEILKDAALTSCLLRVVNSARFAGREGGVGTISGAVTRLGFRTVRNLALGLVLLEHMDAKGQKKLVQEAYLRALCSATLAKEWSATAQEAEELFLGALMQGLGRMLVACYFPDEAQAIRERLTDDPAQETLAARQILGMTLEELGVAVARSWGFPDLTLKVMNRIDGLPPSTPPKEVVERMRWVAAAASRTIDALWVAEPDQYQKTLLILCQRYAGVVGQTPTQLSQRFDEVGLKMAETVEMIGFPALTEVLASGPWLLKKRAETKAEDAEATGATELVEPEEDGSPLATKLAKALQDATDAMAESAGNDGAMQRILLEALCTALRCRCVVLCGSSSGGQDHLIGLRGMGQDGDVLRRAFRVALNSQEDLFAVLCRQPRDTWIADLQQSSVMLRLPPWFRQVTQPRSFLVLPLKRGGRIVGMVYAENPDLPETGLAEDEVILLRSLKNLLLLAMPAQRPLR